MATRGPQRPSYKRFNGTTDCSDIYFGMSRASERTKEGGEDGLSVESLEKMNPLCFVDDCSENGTASLNIMRYSNGFIKADTYDADGCYFKNPNHHIPAKEIPGWLLVSIEKGKESDDKEEKEGAERAERLMKKG